MKIQLKLMFILFGVSFIFLVGCNKHHGVATTITGTNLSELKPGTLTGTFIATGGLNTSGTYVMVVQPVGADSAHCTWTLTAPEGTFILLQDCSLPTLTGSWHIISGTGHYEDLRGDGSITMMFPPNVPPEFLALKRTLE